MLHHPLIVNQTSCPGNGGGGVSLHRALLIGYFSEDIALSQWAAFYTGSRKSLSAVNTKLMCDSETFYSRGPKTSMKCPYADTETNVHVCMCVCYLGLAGRSSVGTELRRSERWTAEH